MQERQVTIGETTYPLSDPFLVLATQNPLEQEGTYQLPEAQLDRFMLKLNVGYPQKAEERRILDLMATSAPDLRVNPVIDPKQIIAARDVVNQIYIDDRVKDYIVDVVFATREPASYNLRLEGLIRYGASPRATIYLALGARAHAFLNGRGYVTPQDVKSIGPDVLRHRIIVSYEAEAEAVTSETIIERIFFCRTSLGFGRPVRILASDFASMEEGRDVGRNSGRNSKEDPRARDQNPRSGRNGLSPAITIVFSKDAE